MGIFYLMITELISFGWILWKLELIYWVHILELDFGNLFARKVAVSKKILILGTNGKKAFL